MALVVYTGINNLTNFPVHSSSVSAADDEISNYVGLSNQGATCYLNSVIQTMFMTPDFRRAVFKWKYDKEKDGEESFCIPLQLQRLFGYLQLSKSKAVDTVDLTRSFGWEGTEVFQQQDVQELTRVLFDALEECFRGTEVENIIDQLYAGELIDYLRCMDVDYQSERVDKFLDFALAILPFGSTEALGSLSECIETYLRPEILDGENKYYAESVGRKVDAIKGLKFSKLPHIMTVQLKRFVYDFTGMQKKVNDRVTFPMLLDMNTYVVRKSSTQGDSNAQNISTEALPEGTVELEEGEFELFLKEQIAILRKEQKSRGDNDGEDCGKIVVNQDSTESSNGNTTCSSKSTSRNGIEPSISLPDQASSVYVTAVGVTLVPQGEYDGFQDNSDTAPAVAVPLLGDARYSSMTSTAVNHSVENEVVATPYSSHTLCPLFSNIDSDIDIEVDSHLGTLGGGIGTYPYSTSTGNPYSSVTGTSIQESISKSTVGGIEEKISKGQMGVECHLMPDTEEIDKLLMKRGEWVYELYAVLNHSGAISGGHYYAYIKNLETKKWYNFNDSNVSEISAEKVFEAWGGKSKYEVASPYARLSDANAYMLMYRKISHSSHPPTPTPILASSATPVSTAIDLHGVGAEINENPALKVSVHSPETAHLPTISNPPSVSIPLSITSTDSAPDLLHGSDANSQLEDPPPVPATAPPFGEASSHPEVTESTIFSGVFPLDSDIPQYIRDDVIKMEEEAVEKRKKIEATRNKLELKVFWKNSEKTVFISRRQTLFELFQTIWYQFALADEEDFAMSGREAVSSISNVDVDLDDISVTKEKKEKEVEREKEKEREGIIGIGLVRDAEEKERTSSLASDVKDEREVKEEKDIKEEKEAEVDMDMDMKGTMEEKEGNYEESESKQSDSIDLFRSYLFSDEAAKQMRLRFYNMSSKVATDVFDFSSLSKTLDTLNFSSYRYLILETRKQRDVFPVYFSDGFDVLLEEFDSDLKEFREARSVRLPKDGTLLNLKELILPWVTYPLSEIRLLRMYMMGAQGSGKVEEIEGTPQSLLKEDHKIYDGCKVYFERRTDSPPYDSPAFTAFVNSKNSMTIRVNKPPSEKYDFPLLIDTRWKIEKLREVIAEEINLSSGDLRMFKAGVSGLELKDPSSLVSQNGFYGGINIAISIGKVTPIGFFNLNISLFTPKNVRVGAILLPESTADCETESVTSTPPLGSSLSSSPVPPDLDSEVEIINMDVDSDDVCMALNGAKATATFGDVTYDLEAYNADDNGGGYNDSSKYADPYNDTYDEYYDESANKIIPTARGEESYYRCNNGNYNKFYTEHDDYTENELENENDSEGMKDFMANKSSYIQSSTSNIHNMEDRFPELIPVPTDSGMAMIGDIDEDIVYGGEASIFITYYTIENVSDYYNRSPASRLCSNNANSESDGTNNENYINSTDQNNESTNNHESSDNTNNNNNNNSNNNSNSTKRQSDTNNSHVSESSCFISFEGSRSLEILQGSTYLRVYLLLSDTLNVSPCDFRLWVIGSVPRDEDSSSNNDNDSSSGYQNNSDVSSSHYVINDNTNKRTNTNPDSKNEITRCIDFTSSWNEIVRESVFYVEVLSAERVISDESFDANFRCFRYDESDWTSKLKNELRNYHNTQSYNQSNGYSSFETNFNVNYTEDIFDKENKTTAQYALFNENDAIFGCGLGSSNPPLYEKNCLSSRTRMNLKNELDAISTEIVRLFGYYPTRIPRNSYLLFVKVFNPYMHAKSSTDTNSAATGASASAGAGAATGNAATYASAAAGSDTCAGSSAGADSGPLSSESGSGSSSVLTPALIPTPVPVPIAANVNPDAAGIDTSADKGKKSKIPECYLPPLPPLYISPIAAGADTITLSPSVSVSKPSILHSASSAVEQRETPGPGPQSTTTAHSDTSILPVSPPPDLRSPLLTIGTVLVTPDATCSQLLALVDALISPHRDLFLSSPPPSGASKAGERNGSSSGITIQRSASRNGIDEKSVKNDLDNSHGSSDTDSGDFLKRGLTYNCFRRGSAHSVECSKAAVEVMSEVFLSCTDFIRQGDVLVLGTGPASPPILSPLPHGISTAAKWLQYVRSLNPATTSTSASASLPASSVDLTSHRVYNDTDTTKHIALTTGTGYSFKSLCEDLISVGPEGSSIAEGSADRIDSKGVLGRDKYSTSGLKRDGQGEGVGEIEGEAASLLPAVHSTDGKDIVNDTAPTTNTITDTDIALISGTGLTERVITEVSQLIVTHHADDVSDSLYKGAVAVIPEDDFAERTLEIVNTDDNFAPINGLTDIIARLESSVDELRGEIAKKLIELKYLPQGSSPQLVRIRDKCSNLAGKILSNGTTLSQNGIYSVYDGKTLCVQILEEEENLTEKLIQETENLSGQNSMIISRQNSPYSLLDKPPGYFPYIYDSNHNVDITNTKMRKFYSNDGGVKIGNIDSDKPLLDKADNVCIMKARSEDDYDTKKNNKSEASSDKKIVEDKTTNPNLNTNPNSNQNMNSNYSDSDYESDILNRIIDSFKNNQINPINEPNQPEKSSVIINNNTVHNTIHNSNSTGIKQSDTCSDININTNTNMAVSRTLNAVLLQVQVWHRRTFTVGKKIEVLIRQDEALKSVAKKLAYYFNIPLPYLRILFVPSTSEINLCDLPLNCPTKYSTRAWFDGSLETRKLSDLCDMKLYDGDLLLLQNIREPLRELTETEKKSIEKKNQIPSYYDYPSTSARNYDSNTLKSSTNFDNSTYSTVLQFGARTKKKENGVFIKTQKERKRQSDKEEEEKRVREEAEALAVTQDPSVILPDSPATPSPPPDTDPTPVPVPISNPLGSREIGILPPSRSDLDPIAVRLSDENQFKYGASAREDIENNDQEPLLGTDEDALKMGLDLFKDLN